MILELADLSHRYGEERAVDAVSLGIESGELLGLIGPSGCGKTTVVQAIAGHVAPTAGRVRLRGEDVTGAPPETRGVGVVFQRSTLFPHMTVAENVAYGLGGRGLDTERRDARVSEYLDLVDLAGHREASPDELSGGQRRRVELARALAPEPDVLLLDEPLSALDRSLSDRLRAEIGRIQRETGVATLYVTHDQDDAMALSDRLLVLSEGQIVARGRPGDLYASPPSPFVASFLGRSNELQPSAEVLKTIEGESDITGKGRAAGGEATVHVRPEDVVLDEPETENHDIQFAGTVERVTDLGTHHDVVLELEDSGTLTIEHRGEPRAVGDRVVAGVAAGDVMVFAGDG